MSRPVLTLIFSRYTKKDLSSSTTLKDLPLELFWEALAGKEFIIKESAYILSRECRCFNADFVVDAVPLKICLQSLLVVIIIDFNLPSS